jgi:beta-galactosidase
MRLWSFQAVARGVGGIVFFMWRQSKAGAEKFYSAMVPHGRPEDSRSWAEVSRLGAELGLLDGLVRGARGGGDRDFAGLRELVGAGAGFPNPRQTSGC